MNLFKMFLCLCFFAVNQASFASPIDCVITRVDYQLDHTRDSEPGDGLPQPGQFATIDLDHLGATTNFTFKQNHTRHVFETDIHWTTYHPYPLFGVLKEITGEVDGAMGRRFQYTRLYQTRGRGFDFDVYSYKTLLVAMPYTTDNTKTSITLSQSLNITGERNESALDQIEMACTSL